VKGVVFVDGKVVPAGEARVPVFDRGFLYGDSVYEVLRAYGTRPFLLEPHLERLERSAARLAMPIMPRAEIERALADTLAALAEPDAYVRIVVTRGAGPIGLDPALADAPRLVIIALPVHAPPPEAYRDGVDVVVVGHGRAAPGAAPDPSVKSGNYLPSVLAVAEARRRNAYEAILTDPVGRLTEGSSSNLFIGRGGRLVTPPISVGLLEGITRRTVIDFCRQNGLSVDEQPLWPVDLHGADEAFITSSVRGVVPIRNVDGRPVGAGRPGPLTRRVMDLYAERVRASR
jgi:branched-chain amino acid aminotransferase